MKGFARLVKHTIKFSLWMVVMPIWTVVEWIEKEDRTIVDAYWKAYRLFYS